MYVVIKRLIKEQIINVDFFSIFALKAVIPDRTNGRGKLKIILFTIFSDRTIRFLNVIAVVILRF